MVVEEVKVEVEGIEEVEEMVVVEVEMEGMEEVEVILMVEVMIV